MKNKKKWILLISIMLAAYFFIPTFCRAIFVRRSEEVIGKYILKNTPIGSSKNDVIKFIEKRNYEIIYDLNDPHFLRGITFPENYPTKDYPRSSFKGQKNPSGIGSSHIYICLADYRNHPLVVTSVMCAWIFDEANKLILIDISKEKDSL